MRCPSSRLVILRSSAKTSAGMHWEYRGTICQKSLGNPAIIGETPADRWLCVPSFRTVCLVFEPRQDAGKTPSGSSAIRPKIDVGLITMGDEPRHLSKLLTQGPLARVLREAERRRLETARIRSLLPAEEAAHLVSASTNEAGEWVLVMDTPSWAARARYCVAALPSGPVRIRVLPRGGS